MVSLFSSLWQTGVGSQSSSLLSLSGETPNFRCGMPAIRCRTGYFWSRPGAPTPTPLSIRPTIFDMPSTTKPPFSPNQFGELL